MQKIQKLRCALYAGAIVVATVSCASEYSLESLSMALGNGRNLFTLLCARETDSAFEEGRPNVWPQIGQYKSSTEYFSKMLEDGTLPVGPYFLSLPGIPVATGSVLKAENNAWCVTVGITENSSPEIPVLFTRNLYFIAEEDSVVAELRDEPPFGQRAAVVVLYGGAAHRLMPGSLSKFTEKLRPSDVQHVLRP